MSCSSWQVNSCLFAYRVLSVMACPWRVRALHELHYERVDSNDPKWTNLSGHDKGMFSFIRADGLSDYGLISLYCWWHTVAFFDRIRREGMEAVMAATVSATRHVYLLLAHVVCPRGSPCASVCTAI